MENGIEIDRFLYEIMVIWSAVHELEIDMLLQIYETIVDGKDQKNLMEKSKKLDGKIWKKSK